VFNNNNVDQLDPNHNDQLSAHELNSFIESHEKSRDPIQKLMTYSSIYAVKDLFKGEIREWDEKELDIFNAIKFFQIFLILITLTATYLILAAPTNPWIMGVLFNNIMFTVVIAGLIAMDSFFAFSAFFGFMRISQIYDAKIAAG